MQAARRERATADRFDTRLVSPSFPEILHQLSPNEAKFLDAIFDQLVMTFEHGYGARDSLKGNAVHEINSWFLLKTVHEVVVKTLEQAYLQRLELWRDRPTNAIELDAQIKGQRIQRWIEALLGTYATLTSASRELRFQYRGITVLHLLDPVFRSPRPSASRPTRQ